jgi:hypothetical protein
MAEKKGASRGSVMLVDNSMDWERKLSYAEKHSGFEIFKFLYWGIYAFAVGCMLVVGGYIGFSIIIIAGWTLVLLSIFMVIYGFVISMHQRLMRRHG